jgi:NAD/NADP transhydrogenase alpha subunit
MEGKTMRIGVPKELANETRAAATPKTVEQLLKLGFSVAVESGAGKLASFDDEAFVQAGAEIVTVMTSGSRCHSEGQRADDDEIAAAESGHHAGELYLAGAKPAADGKTGGA